MLHQNTKELNRVDILHFLEENKKLMAEKFGVSSIGLIGSYARNEQNESSDIDFLVDFKEVDYDYLAGLSLYLEKQLSRKIDIVRKSRFIKEKILKVMENEAIYA